MVMAKNKNESSKTPVLMFCPESQISPKTVELVKEKVQKTESKTLHLVIRSIGGDAYSAVRIIKHLRTKYDEIIGVVPDFAYSAATLMLLGTNKILVSPEGYIGPLDKPLEHSSGENISALDVTQSIPNLSSLILQQATAFYNGIRGKDSDFNENIAKQDAFKISWNTALELIKPLVEKMDPILLQKAYRDLKIGMYYGMDLLTDAMFKGKPNDAFVIVNKLVTSYPSHGYAIFKDEMKYLGLVVEDLDKDPNKDKILQLYKTSKTKQEIIFIKDLNDQK